MHWFCIVSVIRARPFHACPAFSPQANKRERAKKSPTYKDLDFMNMLPEGVLLEPETYNALISTLRRDCRVLESFRIMDYSLLVGIHNLDQAAREDAVRESPSQPCRFDINLPYYFFQEASGNNSPVKEVRNSHHGHGPSAKGGGGIAAAGAAVVAAVSLSKQASQQKTKLVAHSTAMESIQAQTEPIDEQEHLP